MGGKSGSITGKTQITCVRLTHERTAQLEAFMSAEGITKTMAVDRLLEAGLAVKLLIARRNAKKAKKELTCNT